MPSTGGTLSSARWVTNPARRECAERSRSVSPVLRCSALTSRRTDSPEQPPLGEPGPVQPVVEIDRGLAAHRHLGHRGARLVGLGAEQAQGEVVTWRCFVGPALHVRDLERDQLRAAPPAGCEGHGEDRPLLHAAQRAVAPLLARRFEKRHHRGGGGRPRADRRPIRPPRGPRPGRISAGAPWPVCGRRGLDGVSDALTDFLHRLRETHPSATAKIRPGPTPTADYRPSRRSPWPAASADCSFSVRHRTGIGNARIPVTGIAT